MDPAKRICLKNLPEGCTKREIAEMVRNRTGTPIHSIDLGQDAAGQTRRYAHFSCEGAKHVLEVLSAGVLLRNCTVYGHPANPHYSFQYAEARRKREREEATAKAELDTFWADVKQRFEQRSGGELPPKKFGRSFYAGRQKYARIAADIAQASRARHAAGNSSAPAAWGGDDGLHITSYHRGAAISTPAIASSSSLAGKTPDPTAAAAENEGGMSPMQRLPRNGAAGRGGARGTKYSRGNAKSTAAAVAAPPPPPPPPPPTKEERKLSGLQAKLAALKEKMKK